MAKMTTEFYRVAVKEERLLQGVGSGRRMEVQPELSLGPASLASGFASAKSARSSSSDSDGSSGKKRKHYAWEEPMCHANLELQLDDPLPLDWEQCLDLHSGRMYYLNRKTLKKSWVRPRDQGVNLELNISTIPSSFHGNAGSAPAAAVDTNSAGGISSGGNMVAVPCVNCHLLVMLCKSSPSCPNCKFVHPSEPAATPPRKLETLSLLR